ncbi:MAG: hypothetical protein JOZ18_09495 [Chloroflexi bacterium]|nr:hypothetical protein [Chloroflexota bacterium]
MTMIRHINGLLVVFVSNLYYLHAFGTGSPLGLARAKGVQPNRAFTL